MKNIHIYFAPNTARIALAESFFYPGSFGNHLVTSCSPISLSKKMDGSLLISSSEQPNKCQEVYLEINGENNLVTV